MTVPNLSLDLCYQCWFEIYFQQFFQHGMPLCITREDLQIDALLITKNQIIIIDFKNYGGTLILPKEEDFKCGRWTINNDIIIKGGSAANPFSQIAKQRVKLIEELNYRLPNFERKSISTLVCFQERVDIIGQIPSHLRIRFGIVDSDTYIDKIVDILDVLDSERNFLSEIGRMIFEKTVFCADDYPIGVQAISEYEEIVTATERMDADLIHKFNTFLLSDNKILTLTGNTKSGKTYLIPEIRDLAFDLRYTEVPVFAYSNRLRRKMLNSNPMIEEVDSLFNTIFDFSAEFFDDNYRKIIPLKNSDISTEGEKKLYIIDDSQLISDSYFDSELVNFGSSQLLNDIFHYTDLENNEQRKIIFIGDSNKLSFGSKMENALNTKYLEAYLESKNMNAKVTNIELPDVHTQSEIVNTCQKVSKNIKCGNFHNLMISSKGEVVVCDKSEQANILNETYKNPNTSKVIVYSNKKADKINMWIKKHLVKNGVEVNAMDFIVFNSTVYAFPPQVIENEKFPFDKIEQPFDFSEPKRVDNGTFGEIISIDQHNTINKSVNVENKMFILKFVPCQVRLQDGAIVETLIFDNYLKADSGKMNRCESIAYQIVLSALEQEAIKNEPFENSNEYMEMLNNPNEYAESIHNGVKIFRDAKDNRRLTMYEREHRKRILLKLNNQGSEYFRLLNASRVKFAWAMTVNRAMAYSFKTVYFDTDQGESRGRTNADYLKWLYTGISLGQNTVQLINWKPLSPFLNTEFNDADPSNIPNINDIIFSRTNGNEDEGEELSK